jgi:hypothetical protein
MFLDGSKLIKISGVPAEIRTEHLLNMSRALLLLQSVQYCQIYERLEFLRPLP